MTWSIRCYQESTQHKQNSFVTLTYDDEHVPKSISKVALQKFFKRLRKNIAPQRIRYFACGEYGERTRRPHYHALIFGKDFLEQSTEVGDGLYTNPALQDAWPYGFVTASEFTMGTACYVAGYCNKKIGDPDTFKIQSTRPGIGHTWLDRYKQDLINTGHCVIDGRQLPVPKSYLERYPEEFATLVDERRSHAQETSALRPMDARIHKAINLRSRLSKKREKI